MSIATGSCLCGKHKIKLTSKPDFKALCHCTDCRQVSGSVFSTNLFVNSDDLVDEPATGLKEYTKKTDSGNDITSHFCDTCGTTLWRDGTKFPGKKIVKEGVFAENVSNDKPAMEFYTHRRANWVPAVEGAAQN